LASLAVADRFPALAAEYTFTVPADLEDVIDEGEVAELGRQDPLGATCTGFSVAWPAHELSMRTTAAAAVTRGERDDAKVTSGQSLGRTTRLGPQAT
jgi:hypothetical protein